MKKITSMISQIFHSILDRVLGPRINIFPGDKIGYIGFNYVSVFVYKTKYYRGHLLFWVQLHSDRIHRGLDFSSTFKIPSLEKIRYINRDNNNTSERIPESLSFLGMVRVFPVVHEIIAAIILMGLVIALAVGIAVGVLYLLT